MVEKRESCVDYTIEQYISDRVAFYRDCGLNLAMSKECAEEDSMTLIEKFGDNYFKKD